MGRVVGDVCGKGLEAAALTGLARHTLRAVANVKRPSQALVELNRALLRERIDGRFCTVAIASGARPRVRRSRHGRRRRAPAAPTRLADGGGDSVGRHGTLLGVAEKVALQDDTVILEPGEALVLFTDGIIRQARGSRRGLGPDSCGHPARRDAARRPTFAIGSNGPYGTRWAAIGSTSRRIGPDGALSSLYDAHLRSRTVVPVRASVPRCSEKSSTIAAIRYIPRWEPGSPSTTGRVMR